MSLKDAQLKLSLGQTRFQRYDQTIYKHFIKQSSGAVFHSRTYIQMWGVVQIVLTHRQIAQSIFQRSGKDLQAELEMRKALTAHSIHEPDASLIEQHQVGIRRRATGESQRPLPKGVHRLSQTFHKGGLLSFTLRGQPGQRRQQRRGNLPLYGCYSQGRRQERSQVHGYQQLRNKEEAGAPPPPAASRGPDTPDLAHPLRGRLPPGAPAPPAARLPLTTPAQAAPPTLAHAHLWKTPESRAARRTQPMSGTPARCLMFFRGMPLLPPRARIRAARCGGFSTPRPWPPRELRCSFGGRPREGRPRGLETEVAAPFSTESIFLPRLLPSFSTSGSSSLATSARRRPTSPPDRQRGWLFPAPPTATSPRPRGARRELQSAGRSQGPGGPVGSARTTPKSKPGTERPEMPGRKCSFQGARYCMEINKIGNTGYRSSAEELLHLGIVVGFPRHTLVHPNTNQFYILKCIF